MPRYAGGRPWCLSRASAFEGADSKHHFSFSIDSPLWLDRDRLSLRARSDSDDDRPSEDVFTTLVQASPQRSPARRLAREPGSRRMP
jgi:hypothetical protein